jgi:tetratricopeptide (TPR) repeat protein
MWWFRVFVLSICAVSLVGCNRGEQARVIQVPTIRTPAEADNYLIEAEKISKAALEKSGRDEALTSAEQDNVKEALAYFEGLIAYDPARYQPYFGAGKLAYALGDWQKSLEYMQQAIRLAPPPSKTPPVELVTMIAEAHYVSSRSLFFLQKFDEAAAAAGLARTLVKASPDYLIAEASALLEMKREDDARILVLEALSLDAEHPRAKQLAKLLKLR